MPALGIGAGAFEGDNERKQQQQRDAQLGLQAASLQQQGRQADMADSRARMGMALDQQNRRAEMALGQQRLGEEARRFDIGNQRGDRLQAEQTRQFDTTEQRQMQEEQRRAQDSQFDQEQTLRRNDWEEVENEQKRQKFEAEYAEFKKVADEGNRMRQERASMLESWTGKLVKMALDGGPVAPEALEAFNKATGGTVQQAYPDGLGGVIVKRLVKDPQSGQDVLADVPIDPDAVRMIKKSLGMTDVSDPIKNAYMSDRGQALQDKTGKSMSRMDEIEFRALADAYSKDPYNPDTLKAFSDFKARFSPDAPAQQQQTQQVQPSPERSVIQAAQQQQRASQPTMSKTTNSIRSILTTVVPESERQQILEEINAFDPTGERQDEVLASLQKRYAGKRVPSAPVSEKPAVKSEPKSTRADLPAEEELAKYGITPVDGGKVYAFKAGLLTPKTYLKPEQVMNEYNRLKDAETAKANSPEERKRAEDRRKRAEYERSFGKGFGY
jgi:hypothetical protein